MRISTQIIIVLISGFICGLAVFISLGLQFEKLQDIQEQHSGSAVLTSDIQHIDNNITQWFITLDLFFAHQEGYLANGIQSQTQILQESLDHIKSNNKSIFSKKSTFLKLNERLKNISRSVKKASIMSEADGRKWHQLIEESDRDSAEILQLMGVIHERVISYSEHSGATLKTEQTYFNNLVIFSLCLYCFICLSLWRWSTVNLVEPIVQLTRMAEQSEPTIEGSSQTSDNVIVETKPKTKIEKRFSIKSGPKEMLILANTLSEYSQRIIEQRQTLKTQLDELTNTRLQLIQSEKLASVGQLAAGVAHEINNPIAVILSNINSLDSYRQDLSILFKEYQSLHAQTNTAELSNNAKLEKIHTLEQQCDIAFIFDDFPILITDTKHSAQRVKGIVSDLLDFSHINDKDLAPTDLNQLLEQTLAVHSQDMNEETIIIKQFSTLPKIIGSAAKLSQVFLNLINNAIHAVSGIGGTIKITTGLNNKKCWVEIEDSGYGISEENIIKIFDPFFTTKPIGEGTGLGLHIVQSVINIHQGNIDVTSAIGKGTTFHIDFPLPQES